MTAALNQACPDNFHSILIAHNAAHTCVGLTSGSFAASIHTRMFFFTHSAALVVCIWRGWVGGRHEKYCVFSASGQCVAT